MKKLLLTLVLVISSLTAGAQVYLGGEVGLWRDWNNNETTFALQPEIGYQFSDKWAAGLQIGYAHHYNDDAKINAFNFSPYARYTVGKSVLSVLLLTEVSASAASRKRTATQPPLGKSASNLA